MGKSKPKKIAGIALPSSRFATEATRELLTSLGTCLREMSLCISVSDDNIFQCWQMQKTLYSEDAENVPSDELE